MAEEEHPMRGLTDAETAKLKYVRLYETYQTLQAAHLQVIDLLGVTTASLLEQRDEAEDWHRIATEKAEELIMVRASVALGERECERLRARLAKYETAIDGGGRVSEL